MKQPDPHRSDEIPENIREAVHIVAVALARKWKISLDSSRQKSSYTPDKEATTP